MSVKITEEIDWQQSFQYTPRDKWPVLLEKKASAVMHKMSFDARILGNQSQEILESGAWKERCNSFREFVEKHWMIEWDAYRSIIHGLDRIGYEDPVKKELAEKIGRMLQAREAEAKGALAKNGGDRRSDEYDQGNNITLLRGTSADYLLRRLLRDAPEFVARYEKGEFPSVRQAAIAAGIVKVQTPEEKAVKAFCRLKGAERVDAIASLIRSLDEQERSLLMRQLES